MVPRDQSRLIRDLPLTVRSASASFRSTFTARMGLRARGGEYWVAYRKQEGKLRKSYLGKAEYTTLARLEATADGYIQIHHIKPVSEYEGEVDPETDLVPLCANCHARAHRRRATVISVEELKGLIEKARG